MSLCLCVSFFADSSSSLDFPLKLRVLGREMGAGEEGKHFFKRVSLFPRIIISPYFFFDTTMAARRES